MSRSSSDSDDEPRESTPWELAHTQWAGIDLQGAMGTFDETYSTVVTNAEQGIQERQRLVQYVKTFAQQYSEAPEKNLVDGLLKFMREFVQALYRRVDLAERGFSQLYSKLAELQDPAPLLLSAHKAAVRSQLDLTAMQLTVEETRAAMAKAESACEQWRRAAADSADRAREATVAAEEASANAATAAATATKYAAPVECQDCKGLADRLREAQEDIDIAQAKTKRTQAALTALQDAALSAPAPHGDLNGPMMPSMGYLAAHEALQQEHSTAIAELEATREAQRLADATAQQHAQSLERLRADRDNAQAEAERAALSSEQMKVRLAEEQRTSALHSEAIAERDALVSKLQRELAGVKSSLKLATAAERSMHATGEALNVTGPTAGTRGDQSADHLHRSAASAVAHTDVTRGVAELTGVKEALQRKEAELETALRTVEELRAAMAAAEDATANLREQNTSLMTMLEQARRSSRPHGVGAPSNNVRATASAADDYISGVGAGVDGVDLNAVGGVATAGFLTGDAFSALIAGRDDYDDGGDRAQPTSAGDAALSLAATAAVTASPYASGVFSHAADRADRADRHRDGSLDVSSSTSPSGGGMSRAGQVPHGLSTAAINTAREDRLRGHVVYAITPLADDLEVADDGRAEREASFKAATRDALTSTSTLGATGGVGGDGLGVPELRAQGVNPEAGVAPLAGKSLSDVVPVTTVAVGASASSVTISPAMLQSLSEDKEALQALLQQRHALKAAVAAGERRFVELQESTVGLRARCDRLHQDKAALSKRLTEAREGAAYATVNVPVEIAAAGAGGVKEKANEGRRAKAVAKVSNGVSQAMVSLLRSHPYVRFAVAVYLTLLHVFVVGNVQWTAASSKVASKAVPNTKKSLTHGD